MAQIGLSNLKWGLLASETEIALEIFAQTCQMVI